MRIGNKVTVFGGTGFVGKAVVNTLSQQGYEVTVVVRRPERFREWLLYPNTRLFSLASFQAIDTLKQALQDCDIVVNLLADRSTKTEKIDADSLADVAQKIRSACESMGITRVVGVSQLGASSRAPDHEWNGILGAMDNQIQSIANAQTTLFRPSLLIGDGDDTTSAYIKQLKRMNFLMVAEPETIVQPLWIKDFAKALVASLKDEQFFGKKVAVAGEERLSLKELGHLVAEIRMQQEPVIMGVCALNAKLMAKLGFFAPVASINQNQLLTLKEDLVTDADFTNQFGFAPASLEWAISTYAAPHNVRERYNYYRQEAGRNARKVS